MKKKRAPVVVDTNVTIVANHRKDEPLPWVAACACALNEITKSGVAVIDEENLIFNEYKRYLSFAGQPGVGDQFFKWLVDNRYRDDRVARVVLLADPQNPDEFLVFPKDPQLSTFDRSDRKFVAVALAHAERPPVLNAVDSGWWHHKDALQRNGVLVRFVCGEEIFKR